LGPGEAGIGFVLHKKVRICRGCSTSVEKFGREVADFGPSTRPGKAGLALRQAQDREAQDSSFAGAQDSRFWGVRGDGWAFQAGTLSIDLLGGYYTEQHVGCQDNSPSRRP
jgi:hypothetical protein